MIFFYGVQRCFQSSALIVTTIVTLQTGRAEHRIVNDAKITVSCVTRRLRLK